MYRYPRGSLCRLFVVPVMLILVTPRQTGAQVAQLAELNTEQVRALDRARTVILIPGGILEEHGPYLPSFADGYYNEWLTGELARTIAERTGWTAAIFPTIPLGSGGANEIGARFPFPGTHAVRPSTVRTVFMDLATAFGEQGFLWVVVIHAHGSPNHNRALDQAGDYFHDVYGGRMLNLWGYLLQPPAFDSVLTARLGAAARAENGFSVHAGVGEHAAIMHLRPDLVPSGVRDARSITGRDFPHLMELASAPDWPGYFGAPRHATAALGRAALEADARQRIGFVLAVLDGLDPGSVPRYADVIFQVPGIHDVMDRSARRDSTTAARQEAWLARQ